MSDFDSETTAQPDPDLRDGDGRVTTDDDQAATADGSSDDRVVLLDRRNLQAGAVVVALMALGFLFVGFEVVPVALVAVFAGFTWRRDPGRPLAFAALVMLVLAAVATVVLVPPTVDGWSLTFASDRGLAADAGRLAGLLVGIASVLMAYGERSRLAAPRRPRVRLDHLARRSPALMWRERDVASVTVAGVAAVTLIVGIVVRLALAPRALALPYEPLLVNLRLGTRFTQDVVTSAGAPAPSPPLSPLIIAYVPLSPRLLLVLAGLATMTICGFLGARIAGVRAGLVVLVLAALVPSMWDAPLAVVVAGLCLTTAVMLVDGDRTSSSRVAWGGIVLGLAVLSRPETLLVLPLVLVWSWDRGMAPRQLWTMALAAVATMAPWWVWIHQQTGGVLPATTLATFLNDPVSVSRHARSLSWLVAVVVLAAALGLSARRRLWRDWWILWALPVVSLVLATSDLPARDPLGWAAPLAVTLLGVCVAQVFIPQTDVEQRRKGAMTGPLPFDADKP